MYVTSPPCALELPQGPVSGCDIHLGSDPVTHPEKEPGTRQVNAHGMVQGIGSAIHQEEGLQLHPQG